MKFVTTKDAFLRPLQQVAGVVERRQTLPVLSNVLISVNGGRAELTGTDLEVELSASVDVEEVEGATVTVPARKLLDIWRQLPDGADVSVSLEGEKVVVRAGRFRSALSTLPAADYPRPELSAAEVSIELEPAGFRRLLDRTAFAMAQQDVRFFLNGLLLEFGSGYIRAVATDGHRLALAIVTADVAPGVLKQVIVPRKGVFELQRLLADADQAVQVEIGANHVRVGTIDTVFVTKLIDGRFPEYDRVIPRGGDCVAVMDRAELAQVLARIAILSNEKYRAIRFQFAPNKLTVSANNADHEAAEETCEVQYDGAELDTGFNAGYLQDVVAVLDGGNMRITLHANSSAVLESLDTEDALYVIMPMKL